MNTHTLLLTPSDVLFFRDGRPMEGSSSGHGAAWPQPHILDAVLHHALRRSGQTDIHRHRVSRNGVVFSENRDALGREFGSLQSAGPFPVNSDGQWFFPRPADAQSDDFSTTIHPLKSAPECASSVLTGKRLLPLVSSAPPSKAEVKKWLSHTAYDRYLKGESGTADGESLNDKDIFAAEHQVGIGIDSDTCCQDGVNIYSASYLRLLQGWRLGQIARCMDKGKTGNDRAEATIDLIAGTFKNSGSQTRVIVGGQQRTATVERHTPGALPLPLGGEVHGKLVRWTLLTPAIFPAIAENQAKNVPAHTGGWLPTWVNGAMKVQLKDSSESTRGKEKGESREAWRKRVAKLPPINATLVAFLANGRPQPVTGWALHDTHDQSHELIATGGAKSTHLAVPAGSVYYFECDDENAARALAAALNWHGDTPGTAIQNRRSTLMGEKGFGLGVCGTWQFHSGKKP